MLPDLPRGVRNNNPLNIRHNPKNAWLMKVKWTKKDPHFEEFRTMAYGYRAAFVLIRNHIRRGCDTLGKLIYKWAPVEDNNDTDIYLSIVCRLTGFDPDKSLVGITGREIKSIVSAMTYVECGRGYPTMQMLADLDVGYKLYKESEGGVIDD